LTDSINIAAVMSLPRLGWNDAWGCVHEALDHWRIPVRRFSGVFWGQCMQRAFTECLKDDVDWILAIDYDSMFSMRHLNTMITVFGDNPHMDALAPLQSKRAEQSPLLGIHGKKEMQVTIGVPFQVDTAHFGLTLIRADALKKLPKPWFAGAPSASGEWDDERIDEDIHFWNEWKRVGNTCFVTPDVRIGHLEVVVSGFDDEFHFIQQPVGKWKEEERERVSNCFKGISSRSQPLPEGESVVSDQADSECLAVSGTG
jgi:hypothetical protein